MKLDLHVHTNHSFDCQSDIDELIVNAKKAGLSAIAITDHDTMSAVNIAERNSHGLRIIPGMEITARGGTHIIGLFLKDEIVSRDISDIIDEIREQNGLVVVPHPCRPGSGLFHNRDKRNMYDGEMMTRIMARVDLIESINYRSTPEILTATDQILAMYQDYPQTVGSDAHFADEVGRAYLELEQVKSDSLADIKKALLKSSRQIRFEAFSYEDGWQTRQIIVKSTRKRNVNTLNRLVPQVVRKSIKSIFSAPGNRLTKKKSKENLPIE